MFGQSHLFAPNYPRFSPMGGLVQLGRGDSSRKKNPGPPPWACAKCAKQHPKEMGCGEGEVIMRPGTRDYYEVETTTDVDEVLSGPVHAHRTVAEQLGCKKCKEGQRKRKKAAEAYANPYSMHGLPVTNMGALGQAAEYTCPIDPTPAASYDPSLNCMRDARGNAICSDGMHYPPGCPKTPPDQYFSPGITPDVTTNGRIEGQIPAPRSGAAGVSSPLLIGAGAVGLGVLLFVLFK